ncbi:MAG: 2-C-methyl-D-erythritol 4-phosphate cytidylyltransferase [Deltaproteobacteria bacterium]|nr:MAG: 2-C-methyl-D-erythritol 4-phosphate cytidylyltransferase [Deltaproteobacteria bacterium]
MAGVTPTVLIVPAAGTGKRLGLGPPKALADVGDMALVRATLEAFTDIEAIVEAIVAAPASALSEVARALTGISWRDCEVRVVPGGATRQESVRQGLESVRSAAQLVCVHDGARPLVRRGLIEAVLQAAAVSGAATAARRPADSVREDVADGRTRPLDRERLWLVETPQAFRRELLARAHGSARAKGETFSDDASLVEAMTGCTVEMVASGGGNVKVTTPGDLELVRAVLARRRREHR